MKELLSAYDELSNAQINLIDLRKQLDLLYVEKFFLLGGG
jgi:outer membrane protein TolC